MKRKFWNWMRDEDSGGRVLMLNGEISDETWYGDEVTPGLFRSELNDGEGDVTIWINSPGGDCFAAAQIYSMLMDYKGKVNVRIDSLAASAASVIAMAGDTVEMSPVGMMMIHNPSTISIGDSAEMQKAIDRLGEVKESIINAYELKTGLSRNKLSKLMDAETWFNAKKAVELGFVDRILFSGGEEKETEQDALIFSQKAVTNSLVARFKSMYIPKTSITEQEANKPKETKIKAKALMDRLSLISH